MCSRAEQSRQNIYKLEDRTAELNSREKKDQKNRAAQVPVPAAKDLAFILSQFKSGKIKSTGQQSLKQ